MPLLAVLIIFVIVWWAFGRNTNERTHDTSAEWDRAAATSVGLDKLFVKAARPLSESPAIYGRATSPQYQILQTKLLASGGKFGGSVEVFLAVQVAAIAVALLIVAAMATAQPETLVLLTGVLAAVVLVGYPNMQLSKTAKQRTEEIAQTLPVFSDLLQMPLSAGMGILPALQFTVERTPEGVVRDEVDHMLSLQKSRSVTDAEAFMFAGERLGTAEARAFFTALMQAHTQGMAISQNIDAQAEALREKAFEQRIEKINKMETKISMIVAMHLMPALLIIAIMPMFFALSSL